MLYALFLRCWKKSLKIGNYIRKTLEEKFKSYYISKYACNFMHIFIAKNQPRKYEKTPAIW